MIADSICSMIFLVVLIIITIPIAREVLLIIMEAKPFWIDSEKIEVCSDFVVRVNYYESVLSENFHGLTIPKMKICTVTSDGKWL